MNPENATLFRSTIPGKEKIQVGRWHAFRRKDETKLEHEESISLPEGTVDWDRFVEDEHVSSVLYFSDLSPEGLSAAISETFPKANQLGLLASSTPFITGRPVTLFHNQRIHDTGAVGVTLTSPNSLEFQLPNDIVPLGEPLDVTEYVRLRYYLPNERFTSPPSSEGNLINTLNRSNPTQLLLSRILSLPYQLHTITAGDPSRGTLSLNTQSMAPPVGARVRFYHRRSHNPSSLTMWQNIRSSPPSIALTTLSPELVSDGQIAPIGGYMLEELVLQNRFLAGSENGFILGRSGESPWSCTVPGCLSRL
ncbi:hypothetical protein BT96DRAFT_1000588 [Gymnopus androsaceus JB14]|uniref:FIST domain-containing protein n=1 Tax=Gymnopus androsaceus JB14 TaxID=1447944 RepID=A0A6A4H4Y2_9AGAR|nr:hypothetical protein BT96DRAFT_1000588 [Gymnopus androsaceus JB14]